MIIIICGGIGSGKSISAVRMITQSKVKVMTNFKLKKVKKYHRLMWSDMVSKVKDEIKSTEKTERYKEELNWNFWSDNRNVSIYLDELHNIVDSRCSASKRNILFTQWLSQIRKIFGDTGDQNHLEMLRSMTNRNFGKYVDEVMQSSNNIVCVTQRVGKIDVRFRENSHVLIQCQKLKLNGEIYIMQNYFFGDDNISAVDMMEMGAKPKKYVIPARPYFKYYDSYALISTGGEYL